MSDLTIRDMLDAGVHFGHQSRYWNPKMAPYIFGVRDHVHIIHLERTLEKLNVALIAVRALAAQDKVILFVGTKRSAQKSVREEALRVGMPFVDQRWLGGMLTNNETIRRSIEKLKDLEEQREKGTFLLLTKREALGKERQIEKLERGLGGIRDMDGMPDALFVIDVNYEAIAVKEAQKLGIPVIAVVDSNSDPDGIDWVIPGNDDSYRAVRLYISAVADAVLDGRKMALDSVAEEDFKSEPKSDRDSKTSTEKEPEEKAEVKTEAKSNEEPEENAETQSEESSDESKAESD